MKLDKKGFIAIETIIIASLVLLAGGLGMSKFVSAGQSTTKKYNEEYLLHNGEGIKGNICYANQEGSISNGYMHYEGLKGTKYKAECRKTDKGYYWFYFEKLATYEWTYDEIMESKINNGEVTPIIGCYIYENGNMRINNGYNEKCYMRYWYRFIS